MNIVEKQINELIPCIQTAAAQPTVKQFILPTVFLQAEHMVAAVALL